MPGETNSYEAVERHSGTETLDAEGPLADMVVKKTRKADDYVWEKRKGEWSTANVPAGTPPPTAFGAMPASSKYESRSERTQGIDEERTTKFGSNGVVIDRIYNDARKTTSSTWNDNRGTMGGVDRESHSESKSEYYRRAEGTLTSGTTTETVGASSMSSWKVTQPGTPVAKGGSNSPWQTQTRTTSWPQANPDSNGSGALLQAMNDAMGEVVSVLTYPVVAFGGWNLERVLDLHALSAPVDSGDYWADVGSYRNELGAFVSANRENLIQIAVGVADIGFGLALTATGGGAPPGLLLIAVGADQVYTGIANILTGQKNRSLFEEAGYNLTLKMGFSEGTAGVVGQLTPGLLSLGAGICGGLTTSTTYLTIRIPSLRVKIEWHSNPTNPNR